MTIFVGTSGWQYRHWRGSFYPTDLPTSRWLGYYAEHFPSVEVNNAFYRLPDRATFESWRAATPSGFVVAVKASRYLTHIRRLRDPADPVALLVERSKGLGNRLGPFLVQLPPTLVVDLARLEQTLSAFPKGARVALEARHESWWHDDTAEVLRRHDAAWCLTDRRGPVGPTWRTAEWGYVRFHEGRANPSPGYGRTALQRWAERLRDLYGPKRDVYAYFNNDTNGRAPRDASSFQHACVRLGLPVAQAAPPGIHTAAS